MILIGKAKEDFEKWLNNNVEDVYLEFEPMVAGVDFNELNSIFKNALIIEWFDSVGIYINIEPLYYKKQLYFKQYVLGYKDINEQNTYFKRTDATEEAIKKANEIYNKN